MKIHLIAIGGSIMHNLALALRKKGFDVSGSDDQIFEPAKSKLTEAGLMPDSEGWFPDCITNDIDLIILGMHAKKDNPELIKAMQLGLSIKSFPEFIASQYADKKQIVITGSHGKTTTTSMLIHVLRHCQFNFDFLVGAQLPGYEMMVTLTDAPLAIIEGDEYLSSCLDARPKFLHYNPFINIITGIAWDHYNVFPSYDLYVNAFRQGMNSIKTGNHLVYYKNDDDLNQLVSSSGNHLKIRPYIEADNKSINGITNIIVEEKYYPMHLFGNHNMQNIQAVLETAKILGIEPDKAATALMDFKGAAKRMELISEKDNQLRYRDFAHAPSKVKATVSAIRNRFPDKKILVVLELHTYSSLNKDFLPQYKDSCNLVDAVIVYYDKTALEIKGMTTLDSEFIKSAFNNPLIHVANEKENLKTTLNSIQHGYQVILFLGSGHFGGLDLINV